MITLAQHLIWLSGLFLLTACGEAYQMSALSKPATQQKPMAHLEAKIDSVTMQQSETFPVQVTTLVKGRLPSKCNKIQEVETTLRDNVFEVKFLVDPVLFLNCPTQSENFEQKVDLPAEGLKAGEYVVNVNNIITSFRLRKDNHLQVQH